MDKVPSQGVTIDEVSSEGFEQKFVKDAYSRISSHFDKTRYRAWPGVKRFTAGLLPGSLVVESGCGNGKNLLQNIPSLVGIGFDSCSELIEGSCAPRKSKDVPELPPDLFIADSMAPCLREGIADAVLSIAVIHHFTTETKRLEGLKKTISLAKKGGTILVYVWALEQTHEVLGSRRFHTQDVLVPWTYMRHYDGKGEAITETNGTQESGSSRESTGDQLDREIVYRFYHVFKEGELESLCLRLANEVVISEKWFECNNWAVVLTKL